MKKSPIQLSFLHLESGKLPDRLNTVILKSQLLVIARKHYKKGNSFLWSELRQFCENAGLYPEDEGAGYRISGSHLARNGFVRIGETGKSKTKSRGGAPDVQWKRVK